MSKSADGRGAASITATRLVAAVIVLQGIATIMLHGTWHEPLFLRTADRAVRKTGIDGEIPFVYDTPSKVRPPETEAAPRLLPTKQEVEMNPAPITKRQAETNPKPPAKRDAVSTRLPEVKRNAPMREHARNLGPPVQEVWIPPARPVRRYPCALADAFICAECRQPSVEAKITGV